ncbi:MAG: DUF5591 domain-containing protein [Thermofilaceae archaeon]
MTACAVVTYRLFLRSPAEVLQALKGDRKVTAWHKFIAESYTPPPGRKVLLLYPCSAVKPYYESRLYKALYRTLSQLGPARRLVHVVTVSEPYALVPEEFHSSWDDWYECPGLFEWWCRKHGFEYDREAARESIEILARVVASFLGRARYSHRIAFVRTYTSGLRVNGSLTHRIIIEKAAQLSATPVELRPTIGEVAEIVKRRGRAAWDFYGVAHPLAQKKLLNRLTEIIPIYF